MPSPTLTVCPLGVDSGQGGIMASRVSCSSGSNCFLACGDSVVHVDLTSAALFQDSAAASAGASAAPPSPDSDAGGGVIRPHLAESSPWLWRVVPTAAGRSMRRGGLQSIVARETTTGDGRILVASVDAFGSVQMQTLIGGGGGGGEEKGEGGGGGGEEAWSDAVCVASPACAGSGFEPGWHGVDMLVKDGQQSVQVGYGCGVVWGGQCGRGADVVVVPNVSVMVDGDGSSIGVVLLVLLLRCLGSAATAAARLSLARRSPTYISLVVPLACFNGVHRP